MLKKEIRDTQRILLESSLLLIAFPIVYLLNEFLFHSTIKTVELAQVVYMISGYVFIIYSGLALFKKERKDRALEYLFTLPIPRLKLLFFKMTPRLILVVLIGLGHELLFANQSLIMTDVFVNRLVVAVVLLHLIAVAMSLVVSNLVIGFIGIYLLQMMWVFASEFMFYVFRHTWNYSVAIHSSWTWILPGILILIPLAISFGLSFRSLDLKPEKFHVKPYLAISLPLLALQAIVIFVLYHKLGSAFFK
jgi:hypothetical protein